MIKDGDGSILFPKTCETIGRNETIKSKTNTAYVIFRAAPRFYNPTNQHKLKNEDKPKTEDMPNLRTGRGFQIKWKKTSSGKLEAY